MERCVYYMYIQYVYLFFNVPYLWMSRGLLSDLDPEGPQMYEAMYNIQAQTLSATLPYQATDSGT